MTRFQTKRISVACAFVLSALACLAAAAQTSAKTPARRAKSRAKTPANTRSSESPATILLKKVSLKYQTSVPYTWQGILEVAQQHGEDPKEMLASAKVQLEAEPGSKYYLHVEKAGKTPTTEFDLISDGAKYWISIPARNEYTERPMQTVPGALTMGEIREGSPKPEARDWINEFSLQLVPVLAGLSKTSEASFLNGPVLTAVSKKDARGYQDLLYLTVEPDTLAIPKLAWVKAILSRGEKILVRCDTKFDKFQVGDPIPASRFTFDPKTAKLVDSLPADAVNVEQHPRP